jgi:hypothetical protein
MKWIFVEKKSSVGKILVPKFHPIFLEGYSRLSIADQSQPAIRRINVYTHDVEHARFSAR